MAGVISRGAQSLFWGQQRARTAYAAFSASARSLSLLAMSMYGFFSSSLIFFHLVPSRRPTSPGVSATHVPKPASGFSALTRSRQSWLKNMYALRGRLGAAGSFLVFVRRVVVDTFCVGCLGMFVRPCARAVNTRPCGVSKGRGASPVRPRACRASTGPPCLSPVRQPSAQRSPLIT